VLRAIRLAIEEINKAGGIAGAPITLATAEERPAGTIEAARRLVTTDKVRVILGPLASDLFLGVARAVAIPAAVPILSGGATAPALDDADFKGFALRTAPSDAYQGAALAEIAHAMGFWAVGVLHQDDDESRALAQAFQQAFSKERSQVTALVPFAAGRSDYHEEIDRAAAERAEALLVIGYPSDGKIIVKQALDAGVFNKFLLPDSMKSPDMVEFVGGQFLGGSAGASPSPRPDNPEADAFLAAFTAKYGEPPRHAQACSFYDAVYLAALAAEQTHAGDGARLRDALRGLTGEDGETVGPGDFAKAKRLIALGRRVTYAGASGALHLDAHGGTAGTFAQWDIEDGHFATVRVFLPKLPGQLEP
jgi:ABC-type branched-subunit amino acid transport system substrate-binding protein